MILLILQKLFQNVQDIAKKTRNPSLFLHLPHDNHFFLDNRIRLSYNLANIANLANECGGSLVYKKR